MVDLRGVKVRTLPGVTSPTTDSKREVLEQIESIIKGNEYDDIVWGSDLNWDISRKTYFSRTMASFVEGLGLISLWSSPKFLTLLSILMEKVGPQLTISLFHLA